MNRNVAQHSGQQLKRKKMTGSYDQCVASMEQVRCILYQKQDQIIKRPRHRDQLNRLKADILHNHSIRRNSPKPRMVEHQLMKEQNKMNLSRLSLYKLKHNKIIQNIQNIRGTQSNGIVRDQLFIQINQKTMDPLSQLSDRSVQCDNQFQSFQSDQQCQSSNKQYQQQDIQNGNYNKNLQNYSQQTNSVNDQIRINNQNNNLQQPSYKLENEQNANL